MMTPKEKAKELVNKFIRPTRLYDEILGWEDYIPSAKQCALIAVDEIINARPTTDGMIIGDTQTRPLTINYWEEVKQEIEKI